MPRAPSFPTRPGTYSGTSFPRRTPAPYLQIGTPTVLQFTAASALVFPGVTVTLTTSGPGTTINWTQSEFDAHTQINPGGNPSPSRSSAGRPRSHHRPPPLQHRSLCRVRHPPWPPCRSSEWDRSARYSPTSDCPEGVRWCEASHPASGPLSGGHRRHAGSELHQPDPHLNPGGGPPGTRADYVRVNSPAGESVVTPSTDQLNYVAGPIVTSVTPCTGVPGGGTVVVEV